MDIGIFPYTLLTYNHYLNSQESQRNYIQKIHFHPDHLALISILVCHPFIGKRIVFPSNQKDKNCFFSKTTNVILSRYVVFLKS